MRFFYRFGSKPIDGLHLWYNVHTEYEHLGVSLAGQAAAGIQLSLKRNTSRLLLKLWYHVRRSCGYAILFDTVIIKDDWGVFPQICIPT